MRRYLATYLLTLSSTLCIAQTDTLKAKATLPTKFYRKKQFGIIIGIGTTQFQTSYSNWRQGTINYNDSLNGIKSTSPLKMEFGFVYQINLTKLLSIRPSYHTAFEGGILEYERKNSTEKVNLTTYSHTLSLPFVLNHNAGTYQPYIVFGPTLLYMMAQEKTG